MRLWIDEDLSPRLVDPCRGFGFEATCVRDRARLRSTDWDLARTLLDEGWVLVTNNADDYLNLAERAEVHPGLLFLPLGSADSCAAHLERCLEYIMSASANAGEVPGVFMTNRVIDARADGGELMDYCWPEND